MSYCCDRESGIGNRESAAAATSTAAKIHATEGRRSMDAGTATASDFPISDFRFPLSGVAQ